VIFITNAHLDRRTLGCKGFNVSASQARKTLNLARCFRKNWLSRLKCGAGSKTLAHRFGSPETQIQCVPRRSPPEGTEARFFLLQANL
jgi:hypothetical protein